MNDFAVVEMISQILAKPVKIAAKNSLTYSLAAAPQHMNFVLYDAIGIAKIKLQRLKRSHIRSYDHLHF